MSISEAQLDTWAKPGNQVQSANTYGIIKPVIESNVSPFSGRNISSYLQGSYGNDTNVYGFEADVDIVLQSGAVHYPDLRKLTPEEKALYEQGRAGASYSVEQFKTDVTGWLQKQFPNQVVPGDKAITIKGTENRRKADVLACCDYYRFFKFHGFGDARTRIEKGVCFKLSDGRLIGNFPKQHKASCIQKHADTKNYFKPMVRIVKNMRNRMRAANAIPDGIAPSYYLEGWLWNLPSALYGHSYERSFLQLYQWTKNAPKDQLVCANQQAWLIRKNEPTSWDPDKFSIFFKALGDFWDAGG
jgi:hypothetical protein